MVTLEDAYFEADPRPHKLQLDVRGMTWPDDCSLRNGTAMPLNEPCAVPSLWVLMDCHFLCVAAVACHADPVLMAGLGPDLAYGHIV